MPHPLINKIRQLANISGNKIGDFFLITKTQRARCTAGAHKRPYDQILASKTSPKVPTSPSRNTHFLIKKTPPLDNQWALTQPNDKLLETHPQNCHKNW